MPFNGLSLLDYAINSTLVLANVILKKQDKAGIFAFSKKVDDNLRKKNVYYDDLIGGKILQQLKISPVKKNGFIDYMKSIGKLGGQNKVPRLSNDRKIARVRASIELFEHFFTHRIWNTSAAVFDRYFEHTIGGFGRNPNFRQ